MFQSIAGTEAANKSFGVTLDLLAEAHAATLALGRGTVGSDVMYFETGQGSALSAGATTASTSRRWRRGPKRWPGSSAPCW